MYYRISLEGYQTICVRSFHLQRANELFQKHLASIQDHPKRTSVDMERRNYPKPNIYLYNYQIETTIFLATKCEKTIMPCSYLIFFLIISFILNFELHFACNTTYKNESIHLNSWHHSHKKQIDSLGKQVVLVDILAWTWNIWVSLTENTSKRQKMVVFVRNC